MERCDAVWVCTPTAAHRSAVDAALAAGRAVFCEKPLATDLAGAQSLVDAVASATGVPAQSGLVLRSAPVFPGPARPGGFRARWGGRWRPSSATTSTSRFRAPTPPSGGPMWSQAGGGCLIEHSIHDVDILRFCFGEVEAAQRAHGELLRPRGIEDLATVSLSFTSGLEAI
jgi:predicted dehydrogenase